MTRSPMVRAYLECALWTSHDYSDESGGDPLDANYSIEDCAPELIAQAVADCDAFADTDDYMAYVNAMPHAPSECAERFGHDFWLTRNGHGAGFWDRGLGELGDRLTAAAKAYGTVDLYVGDDGRAHA